MINSLNDAEKLILRRLTEGKTMTQISFELDRSCTWVTRRMQRARKKLHAVTNFQAVSIFSRGTATT